MKSHLNFQLLTTIPADEFLPIEDPALLADAASSSRDLLFGLLPLANPYAAGRAATHCFHLGDVEVLAHSYTVGSLPVRVLESSWLAWIQPDVEVPPGADALALVNEVASLFWTNVQFRPSPVNDPGESSSYELPQLVPGRVGHGFRAGVVGRRAHIRVYKGSAYDGIYNLRDEPRPTAGWLADSFRPPWAAFRAQHPWKYASYVTSPPYFGERGLRPHPVLPGGGAVPPSHKLFWDRWSLESIEPTAFVPLSDDDDVREAAATSAASLERLLGAEGALFATAPRAHAVHVGPDCVAHQLDVRGIPLLVYETNDMVAVRASAPRFEGEDADGYMRRMMRTPLFPGSSGARLLYGGGGPDEEAELRAASPVPGEEHIRGVVLSRPTPWGSFISGLYFTFPRVSKRPVVGPRLRALWARSRGPASQ